MWKSALGAADVCAVEPALVQNHYQADAWLEGLAMGGVAGVEVLQSLGDEAVESFILVFALSHLSPQSVVLVEQTRLLHISEDAASGGTSVAHHAHNRGLAVRLEEALHAHRLRHGFHLGGKTDELAREAAALSIK